MITRIPQPQMWGESPSNAAQAAADLGQKQMALFMNALDAGTKNYLAQKQLTQNAQIAQARNQTELALEASRQKSNLEQLKLEMMVKNYYQGMNDAPDKGAYFMENLPMFKQMAGALSGGDKDFIDSMVNAGAGAVRQMSAASLLKSGIVAGETTQPSPQQPPSTPTPPPPAAATPTPQGQPTRAPGGAPQAFPMWQGSPGAAPTPAAPSTISTGVSVETKTLYKGVPEAAQKAIGAALDKLVNDDPNVSLTAKDNAAIKRATTVFRANKDSDTYKQFIAAGGSDAQAEAAAKQLNDLEASHPEIVDQLNTMAAVSDKDWAKLLMGQLNESKIDAAANSARQKDEALVLRRKELGAKALSAEINLYRIQQMAQNNWSKNKREADWAYLQRVRGVQQAFDTFDKAAKDVDDQYIESQRKNNLTPDSTAIQQNRLKQLDDPASRLHGAAVYAAGVYKELMDLDPDEATAAIAGRAIFGGLVKLGADQQTGVPLFDFGHPTPALGGAQGGVPPTPTTKPAPAAPKPTTPAQGATKRLSPQELQDQVLRGQ